MKEYTFGKKASAAVAHQLFVIICFSSLFAMDYSVQKQLSAMMKLFGVMSVFAISMAFLILTILTGMSGQRYAKDKDIHLHKVDYIYGDLFLIIVLAMGSALYFMLKNVRELPFSLAGIMVTAGCIAYVADIIFLSFYLSYVRRIKADIFVTQTLFYRVYLLLVNRGKGPNQPVAVSRRGRELIMLQEAIERIAAGSMEELLDIDLFHGNERELAIAVNSIGIGISQLVEESIRNEKMKADLITNVSHDIKTPLTSIVNYVDLLKRENLENEKARKYLRILDEKSQRLKQLTEDLVEASKISSGNINLDIQQIDFVELLYQIGGEFNERFEERELTIVTKLPKHSIMIDADGRQLCRALENLYTNAAKYALEKSKIYVELQELEGSAVFTMKNLSQKPFTKDDEGTKEDLTERFVRGEESRTTEGSGLGLSIAKNLTVLMGGKFKVKAEEDLFVAEISFKTT